MIKNLKPIVKEDLIISSKFISKQNKDCKINASSDIEALNCFLNEYAWKNSTHRTYKKETERFLVWCIRAKNCLLKDLNRQDVDDYIEFLKDPKPRHMWCGTSAKKNDQKVWYPFKGPLSPKAIVACLSILKSFFDYLVDAKYLSANPFSLIRRKNVSRQSFSSRQIELHERMLSDDEWRVLWNEVVSLPKDFKGQRAKIIFYLLYFLGLRVSELANATWQQVRMINNLWWFVVVGKGDKLGKVPINQKLFQSILNYRQFLQLSPVPTKGEAQKIIDLSERHISNIVKEVALSAANKYSDYSPAKEKFLKFSPHWLRHMSASRQDKSGINFSFIRENLRHENEQTTRQYVHASDIERHKAMELLSEE